jgi:hypothetical protein
MQLIDFFKYRLKHYFNLIQTLEECDPVEVSDCSVDDRRQGRAGIGYANMENPRAKLSGLAILVKSTT